MYNSIKSYKIVCEQACSSDSDQTNISWLLQLNSCGFTWLLSRFICKYLVSRDFEPCLRWRRNECEHTLRANDCLLSMCEDTIPKLRHFLSHFLQLACWIRIKISTRNVMVRVKSVLHIFDRLNFNCFETIKQYKALFQFNEISNSRVPQFCDKQKIAWNMVFNIYSHTWQVEHLSY